MSKQKYFYYVVVQSEGQAKFVTKQNKASKEAFWDKNEKPLAMSKSTAEDLAFCLNLNFYPSFILTSYYEITEQIFYKEVQKK